MTTLLLNSGPGLNNTYTPSSVPLSPFGVMASEKRSLLDSIADIAGRVEGAVTGIKSGVTALQHPGGQPPRAFGNFELKSLFSNPLVIAGIAVGAVLLLRK